MGLRGLALLSSPGAAAHSHWELADALCALTGRDKNPLLLVGDHGSRNRAAGIAGRVRRNQKGVEK